MYLQSRDGLPIALFYLTNYTNSSSFHLEIVHVYENKACSLKGAIMQIENLDDFHESTLQIIGQQMNSFSTAQILRTICLLVGDQLPPHLQKRKDNLAKIVSKVVGRIDLSTHPSVEIATFLRERGASARSLRIALEEIGEVDQPEPAILERIVSYAREETLDANDLLVMPHHLVIGILRCENSLGARSLTHLGVPLEETAKEIRQAFAKSED